MGVLIVSKRTRRLSAIVDNYQFPTISLATNPAHKPAGFVGNCYDLLATSAIINCDLFVAASFRAYVATKIAETLVLVMPNKKAVVFAHDCASWLSHDQNAVFVGLLPLPAHIVEAADALGRYKAADQAGSRSDRDGRS